MCGDFWRRNQEGRARQKGVLSGGYQKRGHGDMGRTGGHALARGDMLARGHEGRREAALGVFFVLGSWFLQRLQGWAGCPQPAVDPERIVSRRRCACLSANGRLGTAVPTQRDGVARGQRLAGGSAGEAALGVFFVLRSLFFQRSQGWAWLSREVEAVGG
jgi:hypothetical protein